MQNKELEIRTELENLSEKEFQKFSSSLIPGCDNLIGVRMPKIRKIAKRMAKENPIDYLENASELYFEETMLKALIIGNMKAPLEVILEQVQRFIPKITNWSLCDSFCHELKIVKQNQKVFWDFLEPYWHSEETYEIRTALVMMIYYYIEEAYLERLFIVFDEVKREDYYVKMAVAWAVSMCYVSFPQRTKQYLMHNRLDEFTYRKAIQKICESLQVSKEEKENIRKLKNVVDKK